MYMLSVHIFIWLQKPEAAAYSCPPAPPSGAGSTAYATASPGYPHHIK